MKIIVKINKPLCVEDIVREEVEEYLEEKKKKKERLEQLRQNKLRKRDEILVTSLYLK